MFVLLFYMDFCNFIDKNPKNNICLYFCKKISKLEKISKIALLTLLLVSYIIELQAPELDFLRGKKYVRM